MQHIFNDDIEYRKEKIYVPEIKSMYIKYKSVYVKHKKNPVMKYRFESIKILREVSKNG